jgi:formylglycine-generating enzyme
MTPPRGHRCALHASRAPFCVLVTLCLAVRTFACGGGAVSSVPTVLADAGISVDASSPSDITAASDVQVDTSPIPLGPPAYDLRGCKHQPVNADCKDGWCKIPAGCYVAGAPETEFGRGQDSEPENGITLTHPFMIQRTEVTQNQWRSMGFADPSALGEYKDQMVACIADDCPVTNVNWFDALSYANALSEKESLPSCYELKGCTGAPGKDLQCTGFAVRENKLYECPGYRLPMVAEWEYAARAGTRTPYYSEIEPIRDEECHDEPALNDIAWYCWNTYTKPRERPNTTMPVGKKKPNGWGLHDMLGNVGEWNFDHMRGANYGEVPVTNPGDPVKPTDARTIRGGLAVANPIFHRASGLYGVTFNAHAAGIGFRLVRTIFP